MTQYALVGIPFLVALVVVLLGGQPAINALKKRASVQPISPDAPEKHRLKHGTPTMGGLLILAAVFVAVGIVSVMLSAQGALLTARAGRLGAVLATFLFGGLIGIMDDVGKARKKQNKAGLSERAKLGLQIAVGLGFTLFLYANRQEYTSNLYIAGHALSLGLLYYPLAVLCFMGFSNATNFTDGLDGLLSGTTLVVAVALGATVGALNLEMGVFYGALAGACAGFLWFNSYPARVFMGDTGSLAIGMGLTAAALTSKQELMLFIVGGVYLAEIASMMIQRYVFKYRRIKHGIEYAKANRVFRRAPLHHHFEELGWHETQVVGRFWVAALAFAALAVIVAPYLSPTFRVLEVGR